MNTLYILLNSIDDSTMVLFYCVVGISSCIYFIYRELAWWKWQKRFMEYSDAIFKYIQYEPKKVEPEKSVYFCTDCEVELNADFTCPKCKREYNKQNA